MAWSDNKEVRMQIKGLFMDPLNRMPIVVLADSHSESLLPIWIGMAEASAIAMQLENVQPPRPMTHDLLRNVIEGLDARLEKVVVHDLQENTFYAILVLKHSSGTVVIDARPSDAIALALRFNAPIYVSERVLMEAKTIDLHEQSESVQQWLESMEPEDFGKYQV